MTVVAHPLAEHLLTQLRDRDTPPPVFRTLAKRLALAITFEAIRDLPTEEVKIETPLEPTTGRVLAETLVAVPILRAGLGMLEAVTELFPEVSVGYIGLERDDETLLPTSYYEKMPPLADRHVLLLDPMLATGGSAAAACSSIQAKGPAEIRFASVVAAPQGVEKMEKEHPGVPVFTASLDRDLTDKGYILPGLGDFGDRLFGTEPHLGVAR
ncbi:MAG TPA: uracil phosphoribosyltransferase [Actinomycetota bacterium]